jgi:hypothetical protein
MPFDDRYLEIHQRVYKPVCEAAGINCYRIDEIARPGSITKDIVEGIIESDIILADLTGKNPNVFYELGIAHCLGNKTIMTCQRGETLPFDIGNYRVLFYEQSISGAEALKTDLNKAIVELISSLNQTNNPVQDVVSRRSALGIRKRLPIVKLVNIRDIGRPLLDAFQKEKILDTEDLRSINLEQFAKKYDLKRSALDKLVKIMLDHDLYSDPESIQAFVVTNRLHTVKTWKEQNRGY